MSEDELIRGVIDAAVKWHESLGKKGESLASMQLFSATHAYRYFPRLKKSKPKPTRTK